MFRLSNIALVLTLCLGLGVFAYGCVMAGLGSEDTTTTATDPKTGIVTVTHTKKKNAHYSDTTQAGNAASQILGDFGGVGGIISSLGTGGILGTLAGGTGLIGFVGHLLGRNKGWDEREKAANSPHPLPVSPLQPNTA